MRKEAKESEHIAAFSAFRWKKFRQHEGILHSGWKSNSTKHFFRLPLTLNFQNQIFLRWNFLNQAQKFLQLLQNLRQLFHQDQKRLDSIFLIFRKQKYFFQHSEARTQIRRFFRPLKKQAKSARLQKQRDFQ